MTPREMAIKAGIIRPLGHGPTPQTWRDDVPTVRMDSAGRQEAAREMAEARKGPR
jgi:hypothetical protein